MDKDFQAECHKEIDRLCAIMENDGASAMVKTAAVDLVTLRRKLAIVEARQSPNELRR